MPDAPSLRRIELILDDDDFNTIQAEITHRQVRSRAIAPDSPTILPDGDSNLAGAILAECCRDLIEYRALWEKERPNA
jgi:hypothetical protein